MSMSTGKVVVLSSSTAGTQEIQQRRLKDLLNGKKIAFEEVFADYPENKETRDAMFVVSATRGNFPQTFIRTPAGDLEFVGVWAKIEELNEANDIPEQIVKDNNIPTFNAVFANVERQ